jgi:hypothetical protein
MHDIRNTISLLNLTFYNRLMLMLGWLKPLDKAERCATEHFLTDHLRGEASKGFIPVRGVLGKAQFGAFAAGLACDNSRCG